MKKLCIVACLCTTLFTHAATKNDLDKAIRSLDVITVEHIVASVSFTPREYDRYLALAGEVVRSREIWILSPAYHNDVTTPSEMPSELRMQLDSAGAIIGAPMALFCWLVLSEGREKDERPFIAGAALGTFLVGKFFYDLRKCFTADYEQKERLRKKYETAVTIQQLIFAVDVVEA